MKKLFSEFRAALGATLVLALVCCGAYPLIVTLIAQGVFPDQANGSLITDKEGNVHGSRLLGQPFSGECYFHSRPSAAGAVGYDAASSSGSNLGPTSQKLHDAIKERVAAYRTVNGLAADAPVPADAVTASASGLDPHISPRNAELQINRVARARGLGVEAVRTLVEKHTEGPTLGILGESTINVLLLNRSLDGL
ncbi:MAG: K(+)-transporting ATPase subunit C [Candidatus Methylacidiphilales bacterium]|nr:K(+)-transporting ATPase subunit C [Candidatus Methylacidiphilales bacterium]